MSEKNIKNNVAVVLLLGIFICSCEKLVSIPPPINTLPSEKIFSSEAQADGAMAGVYSLMINGSNPTDISPTASFAGGLSTIAGGFSADELVPYPYNTSSGSAYYLLAANRINIYNNSITDNVWRSAYAVIYGANSVIEGIQEAGDRLRDSVRQTLSAEAKLVRGFTYFYLLNFYGDVPLVLTIDFNKTVNLPRSPQAEVYQQVIQDLETAVSDLPESYTSSTARRSRPNKWAATALLARVYLYNKEYEKAGARATEVINQSSIYNLEANLDNVFRTDSREALWQLIQTDESSLLQNAVPEGTFFLPYIPRESLSSVALSPELLAAFEDNDKRKELWIDSTYNIINGESQGITYYPAKYKIGSGNGQFGSPPREYYVVIRLAEMYLIRAEARAHNVDGGLPAAIADLASIRSRAGLENTSIPATSLAVEQAVSKERQCELFVEWGHRWFDLKRTGQAHDVLSAIPIKQPWSGDYQLLYPIPTDEISKNKNLSQNSGY